MKKHILAALFLSSLSISGFSFAADGAERTGSYRIAADGAERTGSYRIAADGTGRSAAARIS